MIFNFCPDCGEKCNRLDFKVFLCNGCNKKHFHEPAASVGVVVKNTENKYLFFRRNEEPNKGTLGIPGGFVNIGETLEEAVERECWEEAQLKVKNLKYYKSYYGNLDRWGDFIDAYFLADFESIGKFDPQEVSEIVWLEKEEINLKDIKQPDVIKFVGDFFGIR